MPTLEITITKFRRNALKRKRLVGIHILSTCSYFNLFWKIICRLGRGYSMDNRRFKLRDSNIAEIGSNENCVCWCIARKIDS